jgi:hypothetical protein
MSNARRLFLLLLVALLQGCNACWIIKPADPIETVTLYSVRFHQYFQPGSFTAFLDGENVTREFAPVPTPKGTSDMVRNTPFIGGDVISLGVYIGVPQNPGESLATVSSGKREHTLQVSCKCIEGMMCGTGDKLTFFPLHFTSSPSPVSIPAGGAAVNMTLAADRPLSAPVPVTISSHLLGGAPGPANHIRINGAAPGAPAVVTLLPAGAPVFLYLQSVSPGGFWLSFETPGAQVGSVTGVAH